ncbi:extracellular solute-binding protein [Paenibacillus nasutitermitis]|uniref:ABC transporter substrate-binding protein n=1 Tax=Paenibacillus nasutitermitis TaxID=1652958 RepID=A0A916YLY8_9BACL|nr:extracellular solute-binding protein [Paenibacillus nasutitermitis]GGD51283.1 ABC transporter substrate-binding protein [Paenibacillus nasutitermitis]
MKSWKPIIYLAIIALVAAFYVVRSRGSTDSVFPVLAAEALEPKGADGDGVPYYLETVHALKTAGIKAYTGPPIPIDPAGYSAVSPGASISSGRDYELNKEVLSGPGSGWVEWTFDAPSDGFYNIEVEYAEVEKNSSSSILYALTVDGAQPFSESGTIEFVKRWRDKTVPYLKDEIGNEIRSMQEEIGGWQTTRLVNYAISSEPLQFHFTKGRHTLRFTALNEAMRWGEIRITAPVAIPSYEEYRADKIGVETGYMQAEWHTRVEAERYSYKSHLSTQTGSHNEPEVSPDPAGRIVYNVMDGNRWKKPGEAVSWEFEVPENGIYELDIKYFQHFQGKSNVYRTIYIDDQVPFQELLHTPFAYNSKLEVHNLGSSEGESYLFRLEKGKHTLRMVVDASLLNPSLLALQSIVSDLYNLEQKLRKMTGDYGENAGDINRTWDMQASFPGLAQQLTGIRDRLNATADYLNGLNQNRTDATNSLKMGTAILDDLLKNPDQIPNKLGKFPDLQLRLGTWMDAFLSGGMTVDYLVVRTPSAKPEAGEATLASKLPYIVTNFFRTFYLKYDTKHLGKEDALEIWVGRGRDYANLLQEMIDQSFTPQTGIQVNVNTMPDANALTLSNAGGDQPDVALGLPQDMPVDYAMRGAAVDLTEFSDYKEVANRFNPGAMRSYVYNQGVYALPETQSYPLLFYRKSIFNSLGLEPPDTWEDVHKLMPTLQENGLGFYHNAKDFVGFFYQNGAELYAADGLRPGFDTVQAYKAFAMWTDLYSKYDLPREVPAFFQHFKLGDMPAGIADYNTYIQLLVSAPEIRGDWAIKPMPGIKDAKGTVVRWAANGLTSAMILRQSERKQEAWAFLDWWTSADVQLQYGVNMESFYGMEYRWNTANMAAMARMPWPEGDIETIKEQNRWTRNVPFVPGGYYLSREMEFAWNRTVVEKLPPKESLDQAYVSLEREMLRKQQNLKLSDNDQLALPALDQPFDWGTIQR